MHTDDRRTVSGCFLSVSYTHLGGIQRHDLQVPDLCFGNRSA